MSLGDFQFSLLSFLWWLFLGQLKWQVNVLSGPSCFRSVCPTAHPPVATLLFGQVHTHTEHTQHTTLSSLIFYHILHLPLLSSFICWAKNLKEFWGHPEIQDVSKILMKCMHSVNLTFCVPTLRHQKRRPLALLELWKSWKSWMASCYRLEWYCWPF